MHEHRLPPHVDLLLSRSLELKYPRLHTVKIRDVDPDGARGDPGRQHRARRTSRTGGVDAGQGKVPHASIYLKFDVSYLDGPLNHENYSWFYDAVDLVGDAAHTIPWKDQLKLLQRQMKQHEETTADVGRVLASSAALMKLRPYDSSLATDAAKRRSSQSRFPKTPRGAVKPVASISSSSSQIALTPASGRSRAQRGRRKSTGRPRGSRSIPGARSTSCSRTWPGILAESRY